MQVFHGIEAGGSKITGPTVLTVGNFDGVHLGHRHLLAEVLKKSKEFNALAGVVTFDPHPVKVLHPARVLKEIFRLEDVLERLDSFGLDFTVVQTFDAAFAALSPRQFIEKILLLKPKHIVIGHDFNFGSGRSGQRKDLEDLGREFGFSVSQVSPFVGSNGEVVSSSLIRQYLASGEIVRANALLGDRPFALHGKVVKGFERGRQIGFPTANIFTDAEIIPRTGVYITRLHVNGQAYGAATNVGYNPTFASGRGESSAMTIESHILNFSGDIYGLDVKLEFLARLRDELKFSSVQALVEQIHLDVKNTVEFFNGKSSPLG